MLILLQMVKRFRHRLRDNSNLESDIRIIPVNAKVGVRDDEVVPSVVESEGYQGYLGFHE